MEKEWRKKEFHDYYRINRMYCGRPRCRPWNGSCGTFCGGGRFAYADHISAYAGVPGDRDSTCIGCPRVGGQCVDIQEKQKYRHSPWRDYVDLRIDFYTGRKLRFLPCAKRNNGRIFKRYDTACRTQIYYSPDHDNEGSAGKQIRGTENPAVHSLRRVNWLYLRFCRCRRRYDDAADPDFCPGL